MDVGRRKERPEGGPIADALAVEHPALFYRTTVWKLDKTSTSCQMQLTSWRAGRTARSMATTEVIARLLPFGEVKVG